MIHAPVSDFKLLLSPLRLGSLTLKNRICMPAMHLNYSPGGEVSEQLLAFYGERARGGVAMITVGGCAVDSLGGDGSMIALHDDRFVPGLTRLARAIHAGGAHALAQLYHAGKYARSASIGRQAISSSATRSKLTGERPHALTLEEIPQVQQTFVSAAGRAMAAGFDGVEILAGAGYLISQFLSPAANSRQDAYGGSFDNRLRFAREVVERVRAAIGPAALLSLRVAGSDFVPGGHTLAESIETCRAFVAAGADTINVTGGWHETRVPQLTMSVPRGAFLYLAKGVREAVDVPVIASNRFNSPQLAEAALREGLADLVNLARPLLADPELPKKLAADQPQRVVHCIACNQGCFDLLFKNQPIRCTVNPRAGHEATLTDERSARPRQVVVIGGGPAGMMAALTAARRGHRVTLLEREQQLGGQLRFASNLRGRQELSTLRRDLHRQLHREQVTVRLGTVADRERVQRLGAEVAIVATGGRPRTLALPGAQLPHVIHAWDWLAGAAQLGRRVVVIGGGAVAVDVAIDIAQLGTLDGETLRFLFLTGAETPERLREQCLRGTHQVTIVEAEQRVGDTIGRTTRWTLIQQLKQYNVELLVRTRARAISEQGVLLEGRDGEQLLPADSVLLALGVDSEAGLAAQLADAIETVTIGDAKTPRGAFEAIHEGFWAAMAL